MARKVKCSATAEYGNFDEFIRVGNKYFKNKEVY